MNEARETSFMYGPAAVQRFLLQNKLVSIIRAHQVVENGYEVVFFGFLFKFSLCRNTHWVCDEQFHR